MSAAMANHARIHPSNSPAAGTCLTLSCACQVVVVHKIIPSPHDGNVIETGCRSRTRLQNEMVQSNLYWYERTTFLLRLHINSIPFECTIIIQWMLRLLLCWLEIMCLWGWFFAAEGELEIYLWNKYGEQTAKSFPSLDRFILRMKGERWWWMGWWLVLRSEQCRLKYSSDSRGQSGVQGWDMRFNEK